MKKQGFRWKLANIIVMTAYEKRYAIVLEKLGKKPAQNMIKRVKDKQLRHRIFQTSFRGIQRAIEEKAREYGHSDSSNDSTHKANQFINIGLLMS